MFKNSKYSKFLTVILVIVIIGVLVGVGFLIYNFITKYRNDRENEGVMEDFVDEIKNREEELTTNELQGTEDTQLTNGNGSSRNRQGISYNTAKVIGIIEISKTGIKYPIYSEVTVDTLSKAVAKQYGAGLNQAGNTVIAGHNYRDGRFFSNNKKLVNGDKISITDESGARLTYTVYNIYYTTPEDTEYFVRNTNGAKEISLTTCSDDSKERLIIWARAE